MGQEKLRVSGLSKRYRSGAQWIQAVSDVSFSISGGEIFAFLGPNGSGKSTTIQCISGLTMPDQGEIYINGLPQRGPSALLSSLASDAEFYWMFTGGQIIKNYARFYGTSTDRTAMLVRKFGMSERLDRKWHQYSSGEQMRIRLIRALLNDPEILLLDEPTGGLDPLAAEALRAELSLLRAAGKAILLTSHHMVDIESLADRVCFLHQGKIIKTGVLSDFRKPGNVVLVEFEAPLPSAPPWCKAVSSNAYEFSLERLAEAIALGRVRSIRSIEESLESYFIRLAQAG